MRGGKNLRVNSTNRFYRRSLLSAVFLTSFMTLCAFPVKAQSVDSRLTRLENEIQTLGRAVFRGEAPPDSFAADTAGAAVSTARLEVRLQQIEMEMQTLTGKVEELNFQEKQFRERMDKIMADFEMRLSGLGMQTGGREDVSSLSGDPAPRTGYLTRQDTIDPLSKEMPPQPSSNSPADSPVVLPKDASGQLGILRQPADVPVPEGAEIIGTVSQSSSLQDPAAIYEQAFSLLRDRQYEEAETAFKLFLTHYPDHDLAANAKYWLGETYYVRKDFEQAARVFAEAYQKYPKGTKGPDNLLKLGMSLAGLGKTNDACLSYSQLKKEYPSGAQPILMRAAQEIEKLDCPQF